jgi:hypothetical protein
MTETGGERRRTDRLGALLAETGWVVVLTDDFGGFREWQRLDNQLRNRIGDAAELRSEMRALWEQVHVEILPVIAWAVRSRPGEADDVVPLVPDAMRIAPIDEVLGTRTMVRLASMSFLDEDERRFLARDGMVRRKLEWYHEKVQA